MGYKLEDIFRKQLNKLSEETLKDISLDIFIHNVVYMEDNEYMSKQEVIESWLLPEFENETLQDFYNTMSIYVEDESIFDDVNEQMLYTSINEFKQTLNKVKPINESAITIDEMDPETKKKLEDFLIKHNAKVLRIFRKERTHFKDNKPDRVEPTGNYEIVFETWSVYNKADGPVEEFDTKMIGMFFNKLGASALAEIMNTKSATAMFYKEQYQWDIHLTNPGHSVGFLSNKIL